MQMATEFVRASEASDEFQDETTEELIMRWERYFLAAGLDAFGCGYVEFSIESFIDGMVKFLLKIKKTLARTSADITACNGFWQAVAEAVAACLANIDKAGQKAYDDCVAAKMSAQKLAPQGKYKKDRIAEERAWDEAIDAAGKAARAAAEIQVAAQPVWVTLTDFNEWIFIRLQGNELRASRAYRLFEFNREQLAACPTLVNALQFFCKAIGVQCSTTELDARLGAISASDLKQASNFVESVYHQDMLTSGKTLQCARLTSARAKEVFLEEYPEGDADKYINW